MDINELGKKAYEMRYNTLEMCLKAGTGHLTSSFSCAEVLTALYHGKILDYNPDNPQDKYRDRFLLSKGHAGQILSVILADLGFFPKEELDKFCREDGKFGGHLEHGLPGIDATSGSLGHGLGIGAGMALASKLDGRDNYVFVLMGDGELYEGSVWESAMFIPHHNLDNLVAIIDRNKMCVTDFTEKIVRLEPIDEKFKAFGWDTAVIDGNDIAQVYYTLMSAKKRIGKPRMIIAETLKGKGLSSMENKMFCHGMLPKGEKAEKAKEELEKMFR